jgi:hypothetical protein
MPCGRWWEGSAERVLPKRIRGHVTETLAAFRRYHETLSARDRWLFNLSAAGAAYTLWVSVAFADPRLLLEIGVVAWAARVVRNRRLERGDDGHEEAGDWLYY